MSLIPNNIIDLKVGDVFRENGARKHNKVVNIFEYEGETYIVFRGCDEYFSKFMDVRSKEYLCGVNILYGNIWNGIVEVNGFQIRGKCGVILDTPKKVVKKEKVTKSETPSPAVETKPVKPLTAFQKFVKVQRSGVINMTDIVTGSRLAGISEEKYEDIMWHYDEYQSGKRV